ncbi:MAG TPA: hypothetical protein VIT42_05850 [Microlunatus sp.]
MPERNSTFVAPALAAPPGDPGRGRHPGARAARRWAYYTLIPDTLTDLPV